MLLSSRSGTGLAVVALIAPARADVLVVDDSGGAPFTQIAAAVAAAQDGDTILVKAGAYAAFTVDHKSLTIVADAGATVTCGTMRVINLNSGQTVVLAGLRAKGGNPNYFIEPVPELLTVGLWLEGNAGPVRVQGCTLNGGDNYRDEFCGCLNGMDCQGTRGVVVRGNSAGVAFERCSITGGGSIGVLTCSCGLPSTSDGGVGVELRDGILALYDCTVVGGWAGGTCATGGRGGDGVDMQSTGPFTGLISSGTPIRGGAGGNGDDMVSTSLGGDGGDGVHLGGTTVAWFVGDLPQGGFRGFGGCFSCPDPNGDDGQSTSGPGLVSDFGVPKLRLELETPMRESTTSTITVRGRAGDRVFLVSSRETEFHSTAMWKGARVTGLPPVRPGPRGALRPFPPQRLHHGSELRALGTIPASGVLTATFDAPTLGPWLLAEDWFHQVWRINPIDGRTLGGFAALTVLDSTL